MLGLAEGLSPVVKDAASANVKAVDRIKILYRTILVRIIYQSFLLVTLDLIVGRTILWAGFYYKMKPYLQHS